MLAVKKSETDMYFNEMWAFFFWYQDNICVWKLLWFYTSSYMVVPVLTLTAMNTRYNETDVTMKWNWYHIVIQLEYRISTMPLPLDNLRQWYLCIECEESFIQVQAKSCYNLITLNLLPRVTFYYISHISVHFLNWPMIGCYYWLATFKMNLHH